jgi:hypothetical protein
VAEHTWDADVGQYRTAAGRLVPEVTVRAAVERIVGATEDRVLTLTRQRLTGGLDTLGWRTAIQTELRSAHVAATALARGGLGNLTAAERGWVGSRLRGEYTYLSGFALELGTLSDAQALARARQYAHGVQGTYYAARQRERQAAGYGAERRVLGAARHCADCIAHAGQGWQPIGTLPPPGQACQCRSRCRCVMEFRPEAVADAA